MASPLPYTEFVKALRDEGLRVVIVGDPPNHNRNHKGPWGPVHGIVIHHTVTRGTQSTVNICRSGHSSLPGPLCHGVIAKDGTVYVVGYGRANHAGLGDDDVLKAVIDEKALPADNETSVDGNRHFYGFECENLGDGKDPWPAVQLEAIEKASAALARKHGWSERSVIGHLEWQPGKIDPRGFTMDAMRGRIAERLGAETPKPSANAYKVIKGDTLTKIGEKLGLDWKAIASLNGIKTPYKLTVGQELKLPVKATLPKPLPAPKKPEVDLSKLQAAFRGDPPKKGTPVSYAGVKVVETALMDSGFLSKKYVDGHAGTTTVAAYAAYQHSLGYRGADADGIPGYGTLVQLGKKHGFTVVR